jgi:hypothetical protein
MGLINAAVHYLTDGSDIEWMTTFIIFCTAFIVKAIEDLKVNK